MNRTYGWALLAVVLASGCGSNKTTSSDNDSFAPPGLRKGIKVQIAVNEPYAFPFFRSRGSTEVLEVLEVREHWIKLKGREITNPDKKSDEPFKYEVKTGWVNFNNVIWFVVVEE